MLALLYLHIDPNPTIPYALGDDDNVENENDVDNNIEMKILESKMKSIIMKFKTFNKFKQIISVLILIFQDLILIINLI